MSYNKIFLTKREFFLDRLSMTFGSLANLYSNSQNPPTPDEIYLKAVELTDKIWSFGKRFDSFPELEKKLEEHFEKENQRVLGRYNSSELWAIVSGRIPPKDFFKPSEFTEEERQKMFWGIIIHEGIQKLFNFEEKKYEIKIDDEITIVAKPDLELPSGIWEIKTREDIETFDAVPDWYMYQCQAYLQAKKTEEMNLILIGWGFSRRIFKVKKNEKLWNWIVERLRVYHQQVKQLK